MVMFFILFTRQEHSFKEENLCLRIKIWIFQSSVIIQHYKCNICFATVLMHKITGTGYLKLHEVCFLFQMEHPSEER